MIYKTPAKRPHSQPLMQPFDLPPGCVLALMPVRGPKWHDFSGKGNHGTFTSTGFTSKGRFGPGVYFDGSADYVDCGRDTSFDFTTEVTYECWIKFLALPSTQPSDYPYIVGRVNAARMFSNKPNSAIYWKISCASGDMACSFAESNIDTTNFYHIVGTYVSGIGGKLYLNEVEMDTDVNQGNINVSTADLEIGRYSLNYGNWVLDEVRIYNRALSANEIKQLYEQGRVR